ncbi:MAG: hypothetical protein HRT53_21700 [Colwellia sp.]|nr:hypothetical protein [Colwellia sp.]
MSSLKKSLIVLVVLVCIGGIAEGYNESHHLEMALTECGSQENIAKVDSKGFECKKT